MFAGMGLWSKQRKREGGIPAPPIAADRYVSNTYGNDLNDGLTPETSWKTTTPLKTTILGLAAASLLTAYIYPDLYDNDTANLNITASPAANVAVIIHVEQGTIFRGVNGADASWLNYAGANAWDLTIIGRGPIKGPNQPRVTRYNAGSGNGLGAAATNPNGVCRVENFQVDDCVDGWSMHLQSTMEVVDCRFSNCSKAAFTHVHTAGLASALRCDFIGLTAATLGIGDDQNTSANNTECDDCTFIPATNGQALGIGNGIWTNCILGTFAARVQINRLVGATLDSCFVNFGFDANTTGTFNECYGFRSIRHRNGGLLTFNHCRWRGGATGATNAAVYANFNPGGNSTIIDKNSIFENFGTGCFGNGMDATTAVQYIDGGSECGWNCLFNNTAPNFDADVSANAGFAAYAHNNITVDPIAGPGNTTVKADWEILDGSPCVGTGEGGSNIGFGNAEPPIPNAPTITGIMSDGGPVIDGGTTTDHNLTVRVNVAGTGAIAGNTVTLYNALTPIIGDGLDAADIIAGFLDVATGILPDGAYNFRATITNVSGESVKSTDDAWNITIETAPAGFAFELTAGQSAPFFGYSRVGSFSGLPPFGSIDAEPIPGEILDAFVGFGGSMQISFMGDLVAVVSGLTVWVDGVEYPFDTDWTFDGDVTLGAWSGTGPILANTVVYEVEIK